MAKFDTYTLSLQLGKPEQSVALSISVLFEDGDDVATILQSARDQLKTEAIAMKSTGFIASIKQ